MAIRNRLRPWMVAVPMLLGPMLLLGPILLLGVSSAQAQSPVATGAPLEGPVTLNRDVEVRVGPNQDARIVKTMKSGESVNALGTPRGTAWTQIAIGGQPVGYVPADSLDTVYIPSSRPTYIAPAPAKNSKGGKTPQ